MRPRTFTQRVSDLHGALQEELREALVHNGQEVIDLFHQEHVDKDELLSVVELDNALTHLTLDVPPAAVQELYDEIDQGVVDEGGDGLTLTWLNAWVLTQLDKKEEKQQALREQLKANAEDVLRHFESWATDPNALISIHNLSEGIAELGYESSEESVGVLFDELDSDGTGFVPLPELKRWLLHKPDSEEQHWQCVRDGLRSHGARLMRVFEEWDIDEDGKLEVDELARALRQIGYPASRGVVAKVFDELDEDGSGAICLSELNRYLLRKIHTKAELHAELQGGLRAHRVRVIDLFRDWDLDNDALISEDEFSRALYELGFRVPKSALTRLFDELDMNGDERLSFSELNEWLREREPDDHSASAYTKHWAERTPSPRNRKGAQSRSLDREQKRRLCATLMQRFPDHSEREIRKALRQVNWHGGDAGLLLSGTVGHSPSRRRQMSPPAGGERMYAHGQAHDSAKRDGFPPTPLTSVQIRRRQRHDKVAADRSEAIYDLLYS